MISTNVSPIPTTVVSMLFATTLLDRLHVNVKMASKEMAQHVVCMRAIHFVISDLQNAMIIIVIITNSSGFISYDYDYDYDTEINV